MTKPTMERIDDLEFALREAIKPALCRDATPHHAVVAILEVQSILRELASIKELRPRR